MISFNASLNNNNVSLNWATASEVNNDYFTIERSKDGQNFEALLTKRGAGNSTVRRDYEANDPNPFQGYSYYRLKQTDYDGRFTYSKVETIKNKGGNDIDEAAVEITAISPNPFGDEFKIDFILKQKPRLRSVWLTQKGRSYLEKLLLQKMAIIHTSLTTTKVLQVDIILFPSATKGKRLQRRS